MSLTQDEMPQRAVVQFNCTGQAVGKMRNELDVRMVKPFEERFELATDEGAFHGGDASAPPPLALFVGGLAGCLMTQIRAFAKRLDVTISDLKVDVRVQWDWEAKGRVYETAPKSFEIDVFLDSQDPLDAQLNLIQAAKKGCFIEQTLGQSNSIRHRIRHEGEWMSID
ncbi:OsmC family protein [uncultured Shimia sp.]|uniref:OsmC family protein n=1 Tax=uncultured Shimia sp. TaxID=573152 RepID=UPI00260A3F47|nr:OsmC family protein [uncultured Shimia sp.]